MGGSHLSCCRFVNILVGLLLLVCFFHFGCLFGDFDFLLLGYTMITKKHVSIPKASKGCFLEAFRYLKPTKQHPFEGF